MSLDPREDCVTHSPKACVSGRSFDLMPCSLILRLGHCRRFFELSFATSSLS